MKLSGYGIELSAVTEAKIEKIRKWRNHPEIMDVMLDKKQISQQQQIKWFNSLETQKSSLYLIISYKGEDIGMIYATSMDKQQPLLIAEKVSPGLYIAPDCRYKNSILAFSPSLVFIEYLFNAGKCLELQAQVFESNQAAIRYNKMLGYQVSNTDQNGLLTMTLTEQSFQQAQQALNKVLRF